MRSGLTSWAKCAFFLANLGDQGSVYTAPYTCIVGHTSCWSKHLTIIGRRKKRKRKVSGNHFSTSWLFFFLDFCKLDIFIFNLYLIRLHCFRSNVLGTKFTVYDGGENPEKKPFIKECESVRQELAAICYVSLNLLFIPIQHTQNPS